MQARVNGNFPFAGKQRKTGDVISSEDWLKAGETARSALVAQKLVTLIDDGEEMPGHDAPSAQMLGAMAERFDNIEAKQDRILEMLAQLGAKRKKTKAPKRAKAAG